MTDVIERLGTVADLIGDGPAAPAPGPFQPPRLEGTPPFPEPGIYFDLPEEIYHAIPALSSSGIKTLLTSTMDYWADSWMNPDREPYESPFMDLGKAYHCRILEGRDEFARRFAVKPEQEDYPGLLVTDEDVRNAIKDAGETPVSGTKAKRVRQLLEDIGPEANVWDIIMEKFEAANEDKCFVTAKQHRRIEIAAKMIEAHPQLCKAFTGGWPEVSIFWHDERTGVPMKARLDYLKLRAYTDLKSFSNKFGRPISRAIDHEIAFHKQYIAVVVYGEAVEAAKRMLERTDEYDPIATHPFAPMERAKAQVSFAWKLTHSDRHEPLWVYQQTGNAPVTRGRKMTRGGVFMATEEVVRMCRKTWKRCAETYGADPWLDIADIEEVIDEQIPFSATDFGEQG